MVRDGLLGLPVSDFDCATRLTPDEVQRRVVAVGFKAVPTGIAHGTVTAVVTGQPIEITTLRRDVTTDGRRAKIAFSTDWREDAARRDFTINALSAEPISGQVHDYFGGIDDLERGHVRFIGVALDRIAEDHLRILRFFRFQARFGRGEPDGEGLDACAARANDLMALSRERIADELLKLLALPDPAPTMHLMVGHRILAPVLPEIGEEGCDRLTRLIARERVVDEKPVAIRRLAALLPHDADRAEAIAARLKLSNIYRKRLALAVEAGLDEPHALAYRLGRDGAIDRLLLSEAEDRWILGAVREIQGWEIPRLPVGGGQLVQLGLKHGPKVAEALAEIERRWIARDFPSPDVVREIMQDVLGERGI
jgi:poly(A) polymerase